MDVITPTSVTEALQLLKEIVQKGTQTKINSQSKEESPSCVVAGATDFLVKLKEKKINPSKVLNISRLDELKFVRDEGERLVLGPLITHQEITESTLIRQYAPILVEACSQVGSVQIRNRGTLGGNLATASPAGDSIPALYVLGATLTLKSIKSVNSAFAHTASIERQIPIREFFLGPGKTVLQPGELITSINIPKMGPEEVGFYLKLGQRKAQAISVVGVAVKATIKAATKSTMNSTINSTIHGKYIERISIACGSIAPTVIQLTQTEKKLTGARLNPEELWKLVAGAGEETSPIYDIRASQEYRKKMVGALLYQGLYDLCKCGA